VTKIVEILRERKEVYRRRRPTIVNMMSAPEIERFLHHGFIAGTDWRERGTQEKGAGPGEIKHFAALVDEQPIGVQVGIVPDTLPFTGFSYSDSRTGSCLS